MSDLSLIQSNMETALMSAGVQSVLPEHIKMSTFIRAASTAIATSADLSQADSDSVVMALTKCATDGLMPDNKEAAIVSYNVNIAPKGQPKNWVKKAQYLPMIDGVLKRARMSGQVSAIASKCVYETDTFDYWVDENGEHFNYRPQFQGGEVKLAFAYARLTNGELLVEVMPKHEIDKVRNASKTGQFGPWKEWYERMACKAVTHRIARRLPNASEIVEMCEAGMNMSFDPKTEKDITPQVENPLTKLSNLLEGKEPEKYLPWLSKAAGKEITEIKDLTDAQASAVVLKLEQAQ